MKKLLECNVADSGKSFATTEISSVAEGEDEEDAKSRSLVYRKATSD
jgi:hypothetical protein